MRKSRGVDAIRLAGALVGLLLAGLAGEALAQSPQPVLSRSSRRSGLAVIVGVERYRGELPPATHAANDARAFAAFAEKTLGIPASRIKVLVDEEAASGDLRDVLERWLPENATADSSIWFYFSGHGTPSLKSGESLLVPYDADPKNVDGRGLPVHELVKKLESLPGKEKFVVLDSCFSGTGERSLISEGMRPLVPVKALPKLVSGSVVMLSATEGKGTSGPASRAPNGLFTYHLLHGMRGAADTDADGAVTASELARYVRQRVMSEAKLSGNVQVPTAQLAKRGELVVVEDPGADAPSVEPPARVAAVAPAPSPVAAPQPPAGPSPGTVKVEPRSGLEVAWIPGGVFQMGCVPGDSQCDDDEKPPRQVAVDGFWLGRMEVTVAAYEACAAAGTCSREPQTTDSPTKTCNWKNGRRDHPMNCLNWNEAQTFCRWAGGRLPTAAEWEYAARSGGNRIYPWGNEPVTGRRANYCDANCPKALSDSLRETYQSKGWIDRTQDDGWAGTAPVGSYAQGASQWGLHDMAGNVWEWTASDYDGERKELRGGGWSTIPRNLRASYRYRDVPAHRLGTIGLRCAL